VCERGFASREWTIRFGLLCRSRTCSWRSRTSVMSTGRSCVAACVLACCRGGSGSWFSRLVCSSGNDLGNGKYVQGLAETLPRPSPCFSPIFLAKIERNVRKIAVGREECRAVQEKRERKKKDVR
jgi:hypothetical protein